MKRLEAFNAAKEIAEIEKQNARKAQSPESVPTISPTLPENPANFSVEETEGKPNRIN